jgi:uncharacterized membrane-anchored protein
LRAETALLTLPTRGHARLAICAASPLVITIVYYTLKSLFYGVVILIVAGLVGGIAYIAGRSFHLW